MQFNFFIGGYFGGYFEVFVKKADLVCFISDYPTKPLEPTHIFSIQNDPDFEILLQFLQNLKWKEIYDNGSCDGTQWTLKYRHKEIKLKSYGSNVYPKGFKKLLRLLNNITRKHGISAGPF